MPSAFSLRSHDALSPNTKEAELSPKSGKSDMNAGLMSASEERDRKSGGEGLELRESSSVSSGDVVEDGGLCPL